MTVVGVDASRGAWLAVLLDDGRFAGRTLAQTIVEILTRYAEADAVAIDIPLGIIESYWRDADKAARKFVGPRHPAVFPTPPRPVLEAPDYDVARAISVERGWPKPTIMSYGMRHRIIEADAAAQLDERLFEVHPEVSFRELAGHPLDSKHTLNGLTQRSDALASAGIQLAGPVNDDLLDAAVAAWSADRYARNKALPLPEGHKARLGAIWR